MKLCNCLHLALCTGILVNISTASAANFGTDLNLTMMPAAGAMGGTGIATAVDTGSAVFGNPATLTQQRGTRFMFGGTYYSVDVKADHDGLGLTWQGESEAGPYLVPNVGLSHTISDSTTLGLGLSVVSGVGSDFRGVPGSLDPLAEILVFGANAGLGFELSDQLSLGIMTTIGFGLGQAGLAENTASTSDMGLRATLGLTYSIDNTTIGAYYRTPLALKYENLVKYDVGQFHSPTFEQPGEIAFGISNDSLMDGKLLLAADIIIKDWEGADSYKDIYDDQTIVALGGQITSGNLKWRFGYIHANSPIKEDVGTRVGDITSLYIEALGGTVPLSAPLVQYVQAVNTEVIWEDQVTFGLGWDINKQTTLDLHAAMALERDEQIGATKVTASAWQMGAAATWSF